MSAVDDIEILGFQIRGIDPPGRVYAHPSHGAAPGRWYVGFNEPAKLDPKVPDPRWSGLPTMFLYVPDFDAALALAREIGVAHKAGNVDAFVGRWERESAAPRSAETGGGGR